MCALISSAYFIYAQRENQPSAQLLRFAMHTHSTTLKDPRVPPPLHIRIPSTSKVYPLRFTRMTPSTSLNLHTDTLHFTRRLPPLLLIYARTPSTTLLQILAHAAEFWHYSPYPVSFLWFWASTSSLSLEQVSTSIFCEVAIWNWLINKWSGAGLPLMK